MKKYDKNILETKINKDLKTCCLMDLFLLDTYDIKEIFMLKKKKEVGKLNWVCVVNFERFMLLVFLSLVPIFYRPPVFHRTRWRSLTWRRSRPSRSWPTCWTWTTTTDPPQHCHRIMHSTTQAMQVKIKTVVLSGKNPHSSFLICNIIVVNILITPTNVIYFWGHFGGNIARSWDILSHFERCPVNSPWVVGKKLHSLSSGTIYLLALLSSFYENVQMRSRTFVCYPSRSQALCCSNRINSCLFQINQYTACQWGCSGIALPPGHS